MSAPAALCEVCGRPAAGETVLMPDPPTVARLFAMFEAHRASDGESWPSVFLCDECRERSAPVFRALARLPTSELAYLSSGVLRVAVRMGIKGVDEAAVRGLVDELDQRAADVDEAEPPA